MAGTLLAAALAVQWALTFTFGLLLWPSPRD